MTPLPPDPENMNDARAAWAAAALRCFQKETATDEEDALTDLLGDLMHLSDRSGYDFENALRLARLHYDAETAPEPSEDDHQGVVKPQAPVSPVDAAKVLTPHWMQNIQKFDSLGIQPCTVVGCDSTDTEIVEPCEPGDAHFWTVYGHYRAGGVDAFEDFPTEADARALHDRLVSVYPHLAAPENGEPASFMEYWEAVDAAMLKFFGIDTGDAGIDAVLIASAQEECQTPEDFARWYGTKYDLAYIDDWKVLYGRTRLSKALG